MDIDYVLKFYALLCICVLTLSLLRLYIWRISKNKFVGRRTESNIDDIIMQIIKSDTVDTCLATHNWKWIAKLLHIKPELMRPNDTLEILMVKHLPLEEQWWFPVWNDVNWLLEEIELSIYVHSKINKIELSFIECSYDYEVGSIVRFLTMSGIELC